jgi:hypothetical protein
MSMRQGRQTNSDIFLTLVRLETRDSWPRAAQKPQRIGCCFGTLFRALYNFPFPSSAGCEDQQGSGLLLHLIGWCLGALVRILTPADAA